MMLPAGQQGLGPGALRPSDGQWRARQYMAESLPTRKPSPAPSARENESARRNWNSSPGPKTSWAGNWRTRGPDGVFYLVFQLAVEALEEKGAYGN